MKRIVTILVTAALSFTAVGCSGSKSPTYTPGTVIASTAEAPTPEDTATPSQKNALKKAQSYLKYSAFSRLGLAGQLEYEQFSPEDALWAVDHVGADWNEQAAKKAKSYLDYSAFSHGGLVDQLLYEKFTPEESEYGVTAVGL